MGGGPNTGKNMSGIMGARPSVPTTSLANYYNQQKPPANPMVIKPETNPLNWMANRTFPNQAEKNPTYPGSPQATNQSQLQANRDRYDMAENQRYDPNTPVQIHQPNRARKFPTVDGIDPQPNTAAPVTPGGMIGGGGRIDSILSDGFEFDEEFEGMMELGRTDTWT